jgi:hypothetical protein
MMIAPDPCHTPVWLGGYSGKEHGGSSEPEGKSQCDFVSDVQCPGESLRVSGPLAPFVASLTV